MMLMDINKEFRILFFLCIGACGLFFNYFLSNDYLAFACTIALSIYVLIVPENEIAPAMCFLSPFAYLFRYESFALYVVVCLFLFIRIFLVIGKGSFAFVGFIFAYVTLHLLCTNSGEISVGDLFPFFCNLVLFALCLIPQHISVKKCNLFFLSGFLLSSLMGLFKSHTRLPDLLKDSMVYYSRFNPLDRYSGLTFDSNFYTLMAIFSIFILLKIKGSIAVRLPLFLIVLIFGMKTYSKSFYLSLLFCVLFAFLSDWYKSFRLSSFFRYGIIVLTLLIMGYSLLDSYIEVFMYRIQGYDSLDGITTGRERLWQIYYDEIFSNPFDFLFGHGLGRSIVAAAHNSYLEILYKFGLFGAGIDILYLLFCAKKLKVAPKIADIVFYSSVGMLFFNLSAYTFLSAWTCLFLLFINTSILQEDDMEKICLRSV